MPLENKCFRTLDRLMFKAALFIKGYSGEYAPAFSHKLHPCSVLKKGDNEEHGLLKRLHRTGFE